MSPQVSCRVVEDGCSESFGNHTSSLKDAYQLETISNPNIYQFSRKSTFREVVLDYYMYQICNVITCECTVKYFKYNYQARLLNVSITCMTSNVKV